MIKNPLISVIVPVYNVEDYLEETLKSIIKQNIGFKNNIEIIVINDGSTDNSEEIILKYKKAYPENIEYVKQKNSGVSAARNRGMGRARGEYVSFIDSDDIISTNFYKKSLRLLEKYKNSIDFVTSKVVYIDARFEQHYLNDKFRLSGVVDINKNPEMSLFHLTTALLKRSVVENMLFDERLTVSEDVKFLTDVLIRKKAYGVVNGATYYYRDRKNKTSAIDKKITSANYFKETPKLFLEYTINKWKTKDGAVHEYIQHLIMNDIAWKIIEESNVDVLSDREKNDYKNIIYSIVKKIDNKVIIANKLLDYYQKKFLLIKKYGVSGYNKKVIIKNNIYYFDGIELAKMDDISHGGVHLDFINPTDEGKYILEGHVIGALMTDKDDIYISTNKTSTKLSLWDRKDIQRSFMGDLYKQKTAFKVTLDIEKTKDKIRFYIKHTDELKAYMRVHVGQFTGLSPLNSSYTHKNDSLLIKDNYYIETLVNSRVNKIISELIFSINILKNLQLQKSKKLLKNTVKNIKPIFMFGSSRVIVYSILAPFALLSRSFYASIRDVLIRQIVNLGFYKSENPVWLISDRGDAAGDNGEAFFRFISKQNHDKDKNIFFVISKKSKDFKRLKKVGRVLHNNSLKYKILFIRSSLIISSSADYYVYNPFGYRWTHLNGLYNFKFVFLQHGITKDDLSAWLNRFEKNIKLFVTSSSKEYKSIVDGNYYYSPNEVTLSGMPRYDYLENNPKGKLMLAPTWRHNLLEEDRNDKSGIRKRSDRFVNTEYFKFYNDLINNQRLKGLLRENGIQGEFYLHPAFTRQRDDFTENDIFTVKELPYDYKTAFSESSLLVTDYSSVAFDFAYLRKPVVYCQFDKESLYSDHIYGEGYFSYDKDGFGPVSYNLEDTISQINSIINNNCSMDSKYLDRANNFFDFNDRQNSKRVYNAILDMVET